QVMRAEGEEGAPGSIAQVRAVAGLWQRLAKAASVTVVLVGHVTKQGFLAGPKVLEHLVDVVLEFEGERQLPYRVLRALKNRFGPTDECGVFEMGEGGLTEVMNPSAAFLAERPAGSPGSAVVASLEGSRPFLVEVQALTGRAPFGGTPRRQVSGAFRERVFLVLAVLERRVGLPLVDVDVYVNIAGGAKVNEPALDLGVALAVASSLTDRPVDPKTAVFGEVGLAGEVRSVGQPLQRAREAVRLGFSRLVVPRRAAASVAGLPEVSLFPAADVREALRAGLHPRRGEEAAVREGES
ncbi:MAG TPA: magnesium chelatase domain-containing protein, partial [Limnochordia bacterium]